MFSKIRNIFRPITTFIDKRPFASFLVLLGLLFVLILGGNILRRPKTTPSSQAKAPKQVGIYNLDSTANLKLEAKVEKTGVINIMAQSAGVVYKVNKKEGDKVGRGSTILVLSTNYQGANAPAVSRQMAQKNADFTAQNYDSQIDAINKQKDLAQKAETIAADLRNINRQSLSDTQNLVNLNQTLLDNLDQQIKTLTDPAAIAAAQQSKASLLGAQNSLVAALRTGNYQASDTNPPAQVSQEQRDLTLEQLDLQAKSLTLNRDIAGLNLKLAQIAESTMYPASPTSGVVERIFVRAGQTVAPGTILATIRGDKNDANLIMLVAPEMAAAISRSTPSKVVINGTSVDIMPRYISTEPTDGSLASVIYSLPKNNAASLANGTTVDVGVPIGYSKTMDPLPVIPLDALYQTQEKSYVYVVSQNDGKTVASNREVTTGKVLGQYVEITQGLKTGDKLVLDRNVAEGDLISF